MAAITTLAAHLNPQIAKTLIDHHFKARPFFNWFYKNRKEAHDGGLWYQTVRIKTTNGATAAIDLTSTSLNGATTLARQTSAMQFLIKGYRTPVHITWEDELKSKGPEAIIDVADTQLYQATKEHVDVIAEAFVTGLDAANSIQGITELITPSSLWGQIDPASEPDLVPQTTTASTALTGPGVIGAMVNKLSDGGDVPDLGAVNDDGMTRLQLFAGQMGQLMSAGGETAEIGFKAPSFYGVKFLKDKDMAAGVMPILTTKYINLRVDKVYDFRFSGFQRPIGEVYNTGDIRTALMVVCNNRRRQGGYLAYTL